MLQYKSYVPIQLKHFIESFDYYYSNESSNDQFCYSFLPNGKVHLLFQFETSVQHSTAFTNGWINRPNVFIGGPYDKAYEMKIASSTKMFSVTFKPTMAKYFMPMPISQLRNQLVDPREIWGSESYRMIEQLQHAMSNQHRVMILENFFIKNWRNIKTSSIEYATTNILNNHGIGKTNQYAELANLSISRYRQKFTDEVGFSSKTFQKITRVNAIAKSYQHNPSISFTALAHQFGYFDQSHFIKDFKSVTGHTPNQYFQNRRFLLF